MGIIKSIKQFFLGDQWDFTNVTSEQLIKYIYTDLALDEATVYRFDLTEEEQTYRVTREINSDPYICEIIGVCHVNPMIDRARFFKSGDIVILNAGGYPSKVEAVVLDINLGENNSFAALVTPVDLT